MEGFPKIDGGVLYLVTKCDDNKIGRFHVLVIRRFRRLFTKK